MTRHFAPRPGNSQNENLTGDKVVSRRQTRAGPIQTKFGEWLEAEQRTALPKGPYGEALTYARNQWPTLGRYPNDARFAIDNNVVERALRPLAVGRKNWLLVGGDGGLSRAAVLMSLYVSAKRHGSNPWTYLTDVLTQLAEKPSDVSKLLPDIWDQQHLPARSRMSHFGLRPAASGLNMYSRLFTGRLVRRLKPARSSE